MAQKIDSALVTEIASALPSGSAAGIRASDHRTLEENVVDSKVSVLEGLGSGEILYFRGSSYADDGVDASGDFRIRLDNGTFKIESYNGSTWTLATIDMALEDTVGRDAFGRLRVSSPVTLFDSKLLFDDEPLFWDELLESGTNISSAHSTDTASVVITSTATTAGVYTRQTFMRFLYEPGKSQQILMTGIIQRDASGTGVKRRLGYFDDDNGLFFVDDAGTIKVVRRTNVTGTPVDNEVSQASWNVDVMDGTGPSGITADWSACQIFFIDFSWLGTGRVRMGLIIDGIPYVCHQFLNANVLNKVYISTPNLPIRYQLETTASSPAVTLECICSTVITEGGTTGLGILRYKSNNGTHVDADTENIVYALLGIRLKSTHLGAVINLVNASIAVVTASEAGEWTLRLNPTVAGSPSWGNETDSAVQTFTGATANTVTGGTTITGGHGISPSGGGGRSADTIELDNAIRLGAAIDGTVDEIVLCWMPIAATTSHDVEGALTWRELK